MAFFDAFGCSRAELALRQLRAWRPMSQGRAPPFAWGD